MKVNLVHPVVLEREVMAVVKNVDPQKVRDCATLDTIIKNASSLKRDDASLIDLVIAAKRLQRRGLRTIQIF